MSDLNSKFEFVHGYLEGDDNACMQEQFTPETGYTATEGDIVYIKNSGGSPVVNVATSVELNDGAAAAASVVALAEALCEIKYFWIVRTGMQANIDTDAITAGVIPCVKGSCMLQTENYNNTDFNGSGVPGDTVVVDGGVLRAQSYPGGGEYFWKFAELVENKHSTDGVIIVAVAHR